MRKAQAFLIIFFLCLPFTLAAQENEPDVDDWEFFTDDLYARGDQTFTISLGVVIPTVFINNGRSIDGQISPPVGGTGSLAYSYYFNSAFFVGAELSGMFLPTLGNNTIFLIPLGLRVGSQYIYGRLEFPFFLSFGMCWQTYLDMGHYSIYAKLGASAFFRASNDWSFGLTSSWGWFPQWTDDPSKAVHANFLDIKLSARYHF